MTITSELYFLRYHVEELIEKLHSALSDKGKDADWSPITACDDVMMVAQAIQASARKAKYSMLANGPHAVVVGELVNGWPPGVTPLREQTSYVTCEERESKRQEMHDREIRHDR